MAWNSRVRSTWGQGGSPAAGRQAMRQGMSAWRWRRPGPTWAVGRRFRVRRSSSAVRALGSRRRSARTMVGKEKASLSRASMGRAWQPVGDASWDAEAEVRRRRAQPGVGDRIVGLYECSRCEGCRYGKHRTRAGGEPAAFAAPSCSLRLSFARKAVTTVSSRVSHPEPASRGLVRSNSTLAPVARPQRAPRHGASGRQELFGVPSSSAAGA